MRDLKWLLGALIIATTCFAADAGTNPDPFNVKRAPVISSPAPAMPQPAPVVVAPTPAPVPVVVAGSNWLEGLQNWINTALLALIGALVGKGALWPARTPVVAVGTEPPLDPIAALKAKVTDPALRGTLDSLIGIAANSPLVRGAVSTGLGAVPVAGGFLAQLEPELNALVKKAIADNVPSPTP